MGPFKEIKMNGIYNDIHAIQYCSIPCTKLHSLYMVAVSMYKKCWQNYNITYCQTLLPVGNSTTLLLNCKNLYNISNWYYLRLDQKYMALEDKLCFMTSDSIFLLFLSIIFNEKWHKEIQILDTIDLANKQRTYFKFLGA